MLALILILSGPACPPGTLPIVQGADGDWRCGSWRDLQAYSRGQGGPSPTIAADAVRRADGAYVIDRSAIDALLAAGLGPLSRQARVDHRRDGGFAVSMVRAGSLFWRLGVRDGDVLRSINGLDPGKPLHMLALYALLQGPSPEARVALTRAGRPLTLVWRVRSSAPASGAAPPSAP